MTGKRTEDLDDADFAWQRREMVLEVSAMAEEVSPTIDGTFAISPRVLEAMGRVLRHQFVPEVERPYAYQNRPLVIGHGQTISQPYIVALMTDLLKVKAGDRVLEVGTGSGYQAAVLADLGVEVFSLEIVEALAKQAEQTLRKLGYNQVHFMVGDGYHGWQAQGPFDGVIVTASVSHIPQPLLDQLKPGRRMVIPLGEAYAPQELVLIEKKEDGSLHKRNVLPVRFVPLTGGH